MVRRRVALQLTVKSTHLFATAPVPEIAKIYDRALDKLVSLQRTLLPDSLNLRPRRCDANAL